ncbi:hypothetical protein EDD21DRAFT_357340 [Dissophora ornata]|nr:hypothetical protein EDD21DRAFT_357340 [Dissophora ornata]
MTSSKIIIYIPWIANLASTAPSLAIWTFGELDVKANLAPTTLGVDNCSSSPATSVDWFREDVHSPRRNSDNDKGYLKSMKWKSRYPVHLVQHHACPDEPNAKQSNCIG